MTKEQVISFVKNELECGNSVLASTAGRGGAGIGLVSNPNFPNYLESLEFVGIVEPSADIVESPYYDSTCHTYQFEGDNGLHLQLLCE